MTLSKKGKKPLAVILTVLSIVLVLAIGLGIGYLYYDTYVEHDNILSDIYVASVNVSGMSKEEAIDAVHKVTDKTYATKPMAIVIDHNIHNIDPTLSGADLDVEAAVQEAYEYGRKGFVFRKKIQQLQLAQQPYHVDVIQYLNLDFDAIRAETDRIAERYNCTVVQTTYKVEGNLPDAAQEKDGDRCLYVTMGSSGYVMDADVFYKEVISAYNKNDFSFEPACEITRPEKLDLEAIYQEYCLEPVDAVMDESTFVITDHKDGYGFIPSEVSDALIGTTPGETYTFPFQPMAANVTRKTIEDELFKSVLSEYTAESGSIYNRDINLSLSCKSINGVILLPGEVFSYNDTLGERTPEAGYRLGNTYSGNETIQTYGGGICQTSSTLYYCALMADLEIITRANHSFLNTYVPYGMDATVNWGTLDFQFKNNSDYPIKIEAFSDAGNVTVRILGTDYKDYYVKMDYEVLGVNGWKTVEQEMEPNNPKGYKDGEVITTPYTGYTVQTYRCKYDKKTDDLISREKETYNVYSKRDKVVCKIVEPAAPTDPSAPTEPSTNP